MKILLVRTGRRKQAITLGEFMFSEPIGLECIYAALKDRHQIRILDLMVDKVDLLQELGTWRPDVIGITSLCIDVIPVLQLADKAKAWNPKVITVVGGTQAFLGPESFFKDSIDHVFRFTTRENLKQLFTILEQGDTPPQIDGIHSKCHTFLSTPIDGINDYMLPDRSSTLKYRSHYSYFGYRPCAIMQTSRGCSNRCSFCLRWKIEGCRELDEPLDNIISQIKEIQEDSIMIYDNNFLYHEARLKEFCRRLKAENIRKNFICYGSVRSIITHPDAIKVFAQNGLRAVLVGYESFKQEHLDDYHKRTTPEDNLSAGKILREASVDCWASFILHPDWDRTDFCTFRRYMKHLRPQITSLVPMTPFPGSTLEKQYAGRIFIDKEDYDMWSFSAVTIRPSKMTLRKYYWEVLKSNLYVNLFLNNPAYMTQKFGIMTNLRVIKGSLRVVWKYIMLLLYSKA